MDLQKISMYFMYFSILILLFVCNKWIILMQDANN